ncbi:DUF4135 domain-containing protein [Aquimarina agarilytica]|uniref:DUF4135 domain-containing protein n=1 Tax=Aquimarina agarilytica TaxID=1087449 RepID=UPI0004928ADF|nr:DUF4135 domain-containing protein [Aquimarina agarilytica]
MVLNSTDFHFENVIANISTPILIDHETIIQPIISNRIKKLFRVFNSDKDETVLKSFLLANHNLKNLFPPGMCGLGYSKQTSKNSYKRTGINRFSKDWKMINRPIVIEFIDKNVPELLNGEKIFVDDYLIEFVKGFEDCYRLIMSNKSTLLSCTSPLYNFKDTHVRYIWRDTSIYSKILKHIYSPKDLISSDHYEQKIRNYLSISFKNVPKCSNLWLIFEHEVTQLLRGDIPYFEINSSSKDLVTEHGTIKDFFELSCIEVVERNIKKLSIRDLEYQKKLIIESIQS